ncbi:MAG: hypothetical protein AB199_00530 [Parcubacteria bacterium C7867-004]|nr:MAG: hypothetical protein AB199_00530 [Parcubacteria bacterium C7867-004]
MADTYQLKREIAWHTEEVRKQERELDAANREVPELRRKLEKDIRDAEDAVRDLKRSLENTKRKLDEYTRDLMRIEAANDNKERDDKSKKRAA